MHLYVVGLLHMVIFVPFDFKIFIFYSGQKITAIIMRLIKHRITKAIFMTFGSMHDTTVGCLVFPFYIMQQ